MVNKTLLVIGNLLIICGLGSVVMAQGSSPSYRIDESYVGPGGTVESSSPHYTENSSLGDVGVGSSSSPGYTTVAGFNTSSEPRLSVVVNTSSVSFGVLSSAATSTATATFNVLNYTGYGYSVYTIGATPSNGSHNLTGLTPATNSQTGTEQFGINLKANTLPTSFGADPLQVPSSSFSYGAAASGYDTTNNYRYGDGEKIAQSLKTTGETDYTVSYIVNIATNTPIGIYNGRQGIVVVGGY